MMLDARRAGEGGGKLAATHSDEALLTLPPLTSCSAAWFLIDHGLILVHSPGVATPELEMPFPWLQQLI